jgi:hypothetical protein
MEGQALTWFLLAQKDASSRRAALHCLMTFCLLSCSTSCLRYSQPLYISCHCQHWFFSVLKRKVVCSAETLVSAYLSARCQLGTQHSNSYPFWWCCTLEDDEPRVLVIIQVNSVGYLLSCRLNSTSACCTATTETQMKQKNSTSAYCTARTETQMKQKNSTSAYCTARTETQMKQKDNTSAYCKARTETNETEKQYKCLLYS